MDDEVVLSTELSTKVVDQYLKWKNKRFANSFENCKINKEYYFNKNRTAGVIVAFNEMITSEGLTQIARLIETTLTFQPLKYVCYDNGCTLSVHVKNKECVYSEALKSIKFFVDRFHLKGHVKECQAFS